ncbi:hypothetical protein [Streptomyces agglomeratus]|uniref:hypothetical protein n=1 Tax=Streptomyces agglomeratus TaxID=285458 RepID=UPI00114D19C0|nr:hypothetical protein [Streptomyces agglomeratus]
MATASAALAAAFLLTPGAQPPAEGVPAPKIAVSASQGRPGTGLTVAALDPCPVSGSTQELTASFTDAAGVTTYAANQQVNADGTRSPVHLSVPAPTATPLSTAVPPPLMAGAAGGTGEIRAYCLDSESGARVDYAPVPFTVAGTARRFTVTPGFIGPGTSITFRPVDPCPPGSRSASAGISRRLAENKVEAITFNLKMNTANGTWSPLTETIGSTFGFSWYSAYVVCRTTPDSHGPGPVTRYAAVTVKGLPATGGSLYYSPYNGPDIAYPGKPGGKLKVVSPATRTLDANAWQVAGKRCDPGRAVPPQDALRGQYGKQLTTLAGWSLGRLGPVYVLKSKSEWKPRINHIVLFDPGSAAELFDREGCDSDQDSGLLAHWLAASSHNRLTVLAGRVTANCNRLGLNCNYAGIQKRLFPEIKSHPKVGTRSLREQVVVCPYKKMNHQDVWINFRGAMNKPPVTTETCPRVGGAPRVPGWHP